MQNQFRRMYLCIYFLTVMTMSEFVVANRDDDDGVVLVESVAHTHTKTNQHTAPDNPHRNLGTNVSNTLVYVWHQQRFAILAFDARVN